jgi:hypothetical protein
VARPMTGSTPSPSYVCATSEQGSVVGIRVEGAPDGVEIPREPCRRSPQIKCGVQQWYAPKDSYLYGGTGQREGGDKSS